MATRAAFFLGNPVDRANRVWLGCMDGMGHPNMALIRPLAGARDQDEFLSLLQNLAAGREEWCSPAEVFPFPWKHDLFGSDFTYAWFGGRTMVSDGHKGWMGMLEYLSMTPDAMDAYVMRPDMLPGNTEAPGAVTGEPQPSPSR